MRIFVLSKTSEDFYKNYNFILLHNVALSL